jgi:hypothetical protein
VRLGEVLGLLGLLVVDSLVLRVLAWSVERLGMVLGVLVVGFSGAGECFWGGEMFVWCSGG